MERVSGSPGLIAMHHDGKLEASPLRCSSQIRDRKAYAGALARSVQRVGPGIRCALSPRSRNRSCRHQALHSLPPRSRSGICRKQCRWSGGLKLERESASQCWQSCVVTPNEGKKLRSVRMRSRETRRHASSEWVLLRATCKSSRAHTRRARKQAPRPHVLPIPPHLECPQGVQPCTFRPHIPCVGVKAPRPGSKTGRSSQLAVFD